MNRTSTTPRRSLDDPRPRRSGRPSVAVGYRQSTPSAQRSGPRAFAATAQELMAVPAVIDLRTVDLDKLDIDSLTVNPSDHLTLDGNHALSARDTDPLAQGLFALLRDDCHADRLLVWQELCNTLDGELDDDGRLALSAARMCCADLAAEDPERDFAQQPLAEREYKAWWQDDADRKHSWPSVSSVRRWLGGSWLKVVDQLGQMPTAASLGRRMGAQLGAFSYDDLRTQLALCRKELSPDPQRPLDYVSQREHRAWALRRVSDPDLPLPRLCLQPHPFREAFGSWPAAVVAAGGCLSPEGRRAAARTTRVHALYTADACVMAVAYVGARAGGAAMRWPDYQATAQALRVDSDPPADLPAVLPAASTIIEKLGSWPEALCLAEFIDAGERDRRLARVTVTLTDKQLLTVMATALRAIGADAPHQRYRQYRDSMRAEHGPHVGLPSLGTVYQRLGRWPEARAAVIAAFPDIADTTPTWTEDEAD